MSFKIDTKQFKKIASDKTHVTMRHAQGHELKISLSALSPKLRGDIAAMPVHLADGGEASMIEDKKEETPVAHKIGAAVGDAVKNALRDTVGAFKDVGSAVLSPVADVGNGALQGLTGETPTAPAPAPAIPVPAIAPPDGASAPAAAPTIEASTIAPAAPATPGLPSIAPPTPASIQDEEMKIYKEGLGQQLAGQQSEAAGIGAQGKAEAAALDRSHAALQHVANTYESNQKKLQGEYDAVFKDMESKHIDPKAFWANKSTPGKISTVIGVLLSGLGGGAAGQENMAMKVLNQEIDRDIDAQKANMTQKGNILSALSSQMGNLRAGTEMLRSIHMGMAANEMEKAAALAKDPLAKARLEQAGGALKMTASAQIAKLNAQQTIAQLTQEINKNPGDTAKIQALITATEKVNPEKAKELSHTLVPGMGFALTPEGAKEVKELKGTVDTVKHGVEELKKINNKSFSWANTNDRATAQTISASLVGLLRVPITGPGAMNEGERKMLEGIVADPTKILSLSSSNKIRLDQLTKLMEDKLATTAKANGLTIAAPAAEVDKSKANLDWAKAHPKDPRAQAYLKAKGL